MKTLGVLIILAAGAVSLVFGIIFITQSVSARQQVADDIAPLTLDQLDAKYDDVVIKYSAIRTAEEPKIQAGQAAPSTTYDYLMAQKIGLGLSRTNVGLADFIRTTGIIDIVLGVGLLFSGVLIMQKKTA